MRGTRVVWSAIVLMSALSSAGAAQSAGGASDGARFAQSPQYPLLPRALEIELALSAAPTHLRDDATVWVLDKSGYAIARKGGNAFACVVSRRAGDLFPVCWDAEGTRSLLPLDFEDAPSRAGIAYMLSPIRYRIDEHGGVTRTTSNPHLMFYGPNLTDTDIGGVRGAFVFINRVGPDGMMIVPVGQKEREAIVSDAQSLITQVEQAIGYQPSR
jgi:hypothetical protein